MRTGKTKTTRGTVLHSSRSHADDVIRRALDEYIEKKIKEKNSRPWPLSDYPYGEDRRGHEYQERKI